MFAIRALHELNLLCFRNIQHSAAYACCIISGLPEAIKAELYAGTALCTPLKFCNKTLAPDKSFPSICSCIHGGQRVCIWPGACRRAQSPHGLSSMAHQYSGAEISEACRMMWAGRNHCTRLHQCHPPSQGPSRHPSLHLSCRPDQRHMEQGCLDLPGSCCLLLTSVEGVRQASRLYASDPKQGPQAPMSDLDQLRSSALLIPDTFRVTSWKVFTGCILLAAFSLASFRSLASMIEASAIREGYQGLPDDLLFLDLRFGYSPDEAWTLLRNWGSAGRQQYVIVEIIDCLLYHPGYRGAGLVLINRLQAAFGKRWPGLRQTRSLAAIPFIVSTLDFWEDMGQVRMPPNRKVAMALQIFTPLA